jgi:transcriptional/translational regulatory protein YebC/TACO1
VTIARDAIEEEKLLEISLEAGAEDVDSSSGDVYEVYSAVSDFEGVQRSLEEAGVPTMNVELARIPSAAVALDEKHAEQFLKLLEILEDHDDVQKVYSNFDIPDELMEKLRS